MSALILTLLLSTLPLHAQENQQEPRRPDCACYDIEFPYYRAPGDGDFYTQRTNTEGKFVFSNIIESQNIPGKYNSFTYTIVDTNYYGKSIIQEDHIKCKRACITKSVQAYNMYFGLLTGSSSLYAQYSKECKDATDGIKNFDKRSLLEKKQKAKLDEKFNSINRKLKGYRDKVDPDANIEFYSTSYMENQLNNLWYAYYRTPEKRSERAKKLKSGERNLTRLIEQEKNDRQSWEYGANGIPGTGKKLTDCIQKKCPLDKKQTDKWLASSDQMGCIINRLFLPAAYIRYVTRLYILPDKFVEYAKLMAMFGMQDPQEVKGSDSESCCKPELDFDELEAIINDAGLCPDNLNFVESKYTGWTEKCILCWTKYKDLPAVTVDINYGNTGDGEPFGRRGKSLVEIKADIEQAEYIAATVGELVADYNEQKAELETANSKLIALTSEEKPDLVADRDKYCSLSSRELERKTFFAGRVSKYRNELCPMYKDFTASLESFTEVPKGIRIVASDEVEKSFNKTAGNPCSKGKKVKTPL